MPKPRSSSTPGKPNFMCNGKDLLKLGGADTGKFTINVCEHLFAGKGLMGWLPPKNGRETLSPTRVTFLKETVNVVYPIAGGKAERQ